MPDEEGLHLGRAGAPWFALLAVLCGVWKEEDAEASDYPFAVGDGARHRAAGAGVRA